MKAKIVFLILSNLIFIAIHFALFMSDAPYLWILSLAIHIAFIVFFPYSKFFKSKTNTNK